MQMFTITSRQRYCVCQFNTIGLSSVCIATVFVSKVESGEKANVPKVKLDKQQVKFWGYLVVKVRVLHNVLSPLAHSGKSSTNLILKKHLPGWHFYMPQIEKKELFMYDKSYFHITLLACPIWATVTFGSFKMLARIWLLLVPGNRSSA